MIIEKTVVENNRYSVDEYRDLIEKSVENKQRKEHESWLEQYQRANDAEKRVKELEAEVSNLYKRLAEKTDAEGEEDNA